MTFIKNIKWIAITGCCMIMMIVTSCDTAFDDIKYNKGNADFTKLVAIGGSHLAGYADRALYLEAQSASIPAILANRFAFVNGGEFRQPLVNNGVGIGINGNAKYVLRYVSDPCQMGNILEPQPAAAVGDATNYIWMGNQFTYNNLAVPNTRIGDLTRQSYGDPSPFLGNPLYARFASLPGASTITGDALQQLPTFVLVWMGMEDIYNYARKGGAESGDSITHASVFNQKFTKLVNELSSVNAQGALVNIPGPDDMPAFTAIPYNGLQLTAQEADDLNVLYAADSNIAFTAGANPFVIEDTEVSSLRRLIKPGEYILATIPVDSVNCQGWGRTVPIPQRYTLDEDEVIEILTAISAYNATIATNAANRGMALVDIRSYFSKLTAGILFNNATYSTDYLTGGAFSTDGFHLSQRGSALIANEIITTINRFYSSKIPQADVNAYPGIVFP